MASAIVVIPRTRSRNADFPSYKLSVLYFITYLGLEILGKKDDGFLFIDGIGEISILEPSSSVMG